MTFEADQIVARRRLRRQVSYWRAGAIVVAVIAAIAVMSGGEDGAFSKLSDHVARVRVEGFISGDEKTLKLFKNIAESNRVKAVILHIDSPGGTTVGAEAVFEAVRKISQKKPVVAVMNSVAVSGGYATAVAADHVIARGNTITGSIGVIFQWPDVSQLLNSIGVKVEELKSGELKAEPTPFKPASERVKAVAMQMVGDAFDWFVTLVAERRHLTVDQVRLLADGRVYTGRQALKVKLIDAIGGEDAAVNWLASVKSVSKGTPILDWEIENGFGSTGFGFSALQGLMRLFGLEGLAHRLDRVLAGSRVQLDGLLSVWHPDAQ
ncbi:MAG TPA: signal peptide peptidase SppA [Aestuariivirgaceae bacterium]|nr:signal peptide peptidase SppA [Aestuariivirgaceae bacterium]